MVFCGFVIAIFNKLLKLVTVFYNGCAICIANILEFENFDLQNIVTPVQVQEYKRLLKEAGYDKRKMNFLVKGFTNGFFIGVCWTHKN